MRDNASSTSGPELEITHRPAPPISNRTGEEHGIFRSSGPSVTRARNNDRLLQEIGGPTP